MADSKALELVCGRWLVLQCRRLKFFDDDYARLYPWLNKAFGPLYTFDADGLVGVMEEGLAAVAVGDRGRAGELFSRVVPEMAGNTDWRARAFAGFAREYVKCLSLGSDSARLKALAGLWFDMVHWWRDKPDKGVPSIPDVSKFMVIEWVATCVFVVLGVVVPVVDSSGWSRVIPPVFFVCSLVLFSLLGKFRNFWYEFASAVVFLVVGFYAVSLVSGVVSRWVLWSFAGGALTGILITNHVRYMRMRRWCERVGVFGCVWVRHLERSRYEVVLTDGEGVLVWRRVIRGWFRQFDGLLGGNQSIALRGRTKSFSGAPGGGWVQCFPSLVSTRMVGLSRRNPARWGDALSSTEGVTDELVAQFLQRVPLPDGPVGYEDAPEDPRVWRAAIWES